MRNPFTLVWRRATTSGEVADTPLPATKPQVRGSRLGDTVVLAVAVTVTVAVGISAGFISFRHFVSLALGLGEPIEQAVLYPAAAEGMVIMAGLVMLYCSHRGLSVPRLAWASLAFGVGVALAVNIVHGYARGIGAALVSALAPIAFVASYELLMRLIRLVRQTVSAPAAETHICPAPERVEVPVPVKMRVEVPVPVEKVVEVPVSVEKVVEVPVPVTVEKVVEVPVPVVPADALDAARIAYEHSAGTGRRALGVRALAKRFGIELRAAEEIIKSSQETPEQAADEPPVTALPETVPGTPQTAGEDRHATAPETTPESADTAPVEAPSVTVPDAPEQAPQDRHSDAPETAAEALADAVAVTVPEHLDEAPENRHTPSSGAVSSTPAETPEQAAAETAPDAPAAPPQTRRAAPRMRPLGKGLAEVLADAPTPVLNGALVATSGAGDEGR
ncbi:DUF2637 domain-containing protein [Streptosporangium saharense]|uniref:DUF2637 domain-containing protein n=1 Tax=Streptosporangium saharense TaxID=1706840 RepID=UPI00367D09FB